MSAKDPRKAIALRLSPKLAAAVRAYARHHGDKSLAAACRRAVRAELMIAADRDHGPKQQAAPRSARILELRLQLEPELRHRLGSKNLERVVVSLLAQKFGIEIDVT